MERRRFITTALASSAFLMTQAMAKEPDKGKKPGKPGAAKRHPHPTEHEWHNWGADPYARKDPLNQAKIDKFFEDAKKMKEGMPDDVVESLKKRIHDEPNGTITYITPSVKGQPDTIIPIMESGHGPMYNYPVARFQIAYGIVKAAEVRAWAVTDHTGTTYEVGYPLICGNWSVLKITRCGCAVQAPPPQAQCAYIMIEMHAGSVLHGTLAAPYDLPWTACGPALKVAGSDEYISTRDARFQKPCGDWGLNCSFDAPLSVLSNRIRTLGFAERSGYRFNYQATHHEWVILRLPPIVTENDKLYYYVLCLTENAQLQTRAIPVGSHEYAQFEKGKTAFITYGEAPPPAWYGHFQFWQFVPR